MNFSEHLYEVIMVDNGSTDRTKDIAKEFGAKVLEAPHLKVSGLRNLGAKNAEGEFLAFVDADCTVDGDWLTSAKIYFNSQDIAAWGSPADIPTHSTWVQQAWFLVRKPDKIVEDVEWLESMNLFVRQKTFLVADGFAENLVTCEDVDFCYRLRQYGRIVSDRRIRVIHHGEAATVRQFFRKELWRGMGNIHGVFSHGLSFKELPSLALPLYFAFFLPLLLAASILLRSGILFSLLFLFLILPAALIFSKKKLFAAGPKTLLRLFFLLQVYFLARTAAIFKTRPSR